MRMVAVAAAVALIAGGPVPAAAQAEPERIGLLIVDHGEPPEYNELTYWSFREFFEHLIEMGLIPSWLTLVDGGTVMADRTCYGCEQPSGAPELIDAWLKPYSGPAAFVPGSDSLPAHYLRPGGPGQGEPDIYEHVGLSAWHEWQLMGGRSPNYDQKLPKKRAVMARLARRYPGMPVRVGYGIDPRIGGRHQDVERAVTQLINRERVDHIVVAYHGVGFSDIMQTHMIRHEVEEIAGRLDPAVTVSYAEPIGTTDAYVRAVVHEARRELAAVPEDAPVALHLSGHGLPTTTCGEYDCGSDAYHAYARRLFERTKAALERAIDRPGRTGIFHVYGDGGEGESDPEDEVDGPIEALEQRVADGFRYVIDIPYEFDSDSRDTLIVLRRGYHRPIPDWDARLESRFDYRGLRVKISNASFGSALKTRAFEQVILAAIQAARAKDAQHHH